MICSKKYFSLIELMVVISIVLLVAGIAIPVTGRMIQARSVNDSVLSVASSLRMARQYALTNRKHIAVIIPGVEAKSDFSQDKVCRIFRSAIVDSDYNFVSWVPDSKWHTLPMGASIMEADEDIGIFDGTSYTQQPVENNPVTINGVIPGKIFGLTSALSTPLRAVVFKPSGKLKGSARYLTIGESMYLGDGNFKIVNPADLAKNKSCANQLTIEIKPYTGKIKTFKVEEY